MKSRLFILILSGALAGCVQNAAPTPTAAAPGVTPPAPPTSAPVVEQTPVVAMPQSGKGWSIVLPGNVALDLVWIAPGNFTMGSPASETGHIPDERPQTQVILTKGFWLGKYEVTQEQYQALVGTNPSNFKEVGKDAPVETVSWDDAMAFCQKLNAQERASGRLPAGYTFTLPTEAQWEYACRAGTTGPYYATDLGAIAWYADNSGSTTHPVGTKQPNAWGLYDMLGNVWEWCADWSGPYPDGSVTDPVGPLSGASRVLRGGSWHIVAADCRSACRRDNDPGSRNFYFGFRLALSFSPVVVVSKRASPVAACFIACFGDGCGKT
jgi:formylglycine-generating enzyme required for sulfatase activity